MVSAEVGYAGSKAGVTYSDVRTGTTGNAESVRVIFDPKKLSYESLLEDWFFRMHDPTTKDRQGNDVGSQYRSAIFVSSPAQREAAERVKRRVAASGKWKAPIVTEIVDAGRLVPIVAAIVIGAAIGGAIGRRRTPAGGNDPRRVRLPRDHRRERGRGAAALSEEVPDVLLSDIGMPGPKGFDLIRHVRALPREAGGDVPAAALTAYARTEDCRSLLNAGFSIHVPKPVEPAELVAVIATLSRFIQRPEKVP